MLFKKAKNILSACPKTGRSLGHKNKHWWLIWVFPIAGLLSLIWFLIRVVPKPSRATYPCQRVAAPLASSFVVWITGLIGSTLAYRKARRYLRKSRYIVAGICIAASVMTVWWSLSVTSDSSAAAAFTATEPPNSPMGVAKGIHPGRVVWVHDPAATSWDGSTGDWWDDNNTDQNVVDYMMSKSIQTLTGESNDPNAWDALFRHFNRTRGLGDIGYQRGENITIKLNMNQNRSLTWSTGQAMPSPHAVYSLVDQLINAAGVPGSAITIYDASRYIGDPIYDKIRSNPDPNFQSVAFVANTTRNGRIGATYDSSNPLYARPGTAYFPRCVTGAKYLINMALFRPHSLYGVTLCAKNHFGSVYFPTGGGWTPSPLHNYGGRGRSMDTYNCLVNLNGHKHLGGKTMLYMIDGLYGAINQENNVIKYVSFGDDWSSSIFASQDPVAIDSVGLDFLAYENGLNQNIFDVTGNPDNYMHEAALADNPPSRTFYDPEGDGTRLASLGVHEHWNNPGDKKYSRNLGTGNGIELVVPSFATADGPVENLTAGRKYDHIRYAIAEADPGDEIVVGEGIYQDNIDFRGKSLTVRSTDPRNPAVVAATVISGGRSTSYGGSDGFGGGTGQVVTFAGGEDASCVLAGFTITDANNGIYCFGASPTISNCCIIGNSGAGIELSNGSNPAITNCRIGPNSGTGIEMWDEKRGRTAIYNCPTITNCTIAGNLQHGISDGIPTITNSIIWANLAQQITGTQVATLVTYSNVQGGFPGQGNIDVDPLFADPGYWADFNDPNIVVESNDPNAVWLSCDYHLKSEAGRWDPISESWIVDDVTSPCIDAGDPNSPVAFEPFPNGGIINMGAFGGTSEASKSPSGIHAKYGGGTGDPNDPYLIYTAEQMNAIGANPDDWNKHFKLMADIDLSAYTGTDFNIIGYYVDWVDYKQFSGVFDGNGHTISNFSYTSTDIDGVGLFGYVEGGTIKYLGLIDPNVDAGTGGHVGSLVGDMYRGTINNCYTEGANVAGHERVGGLVGQNSDNVTNCYSNGTVSGNDTVGGLVGFNGRTGSVSSSYSSGSVSSSGSSVGGLVGSNTDPWGEGVVSDSFWDMETSGQTISGGGTGKTTAEMQIAVTFLDAGWDFVDETENGTDDIWWILEGQDYPRLWWERIKDDSVVTP